MGDLRPVVFHNDLSLRSALVSPSGFILIIHSAGGDMLKLSDCNNLCIIFTKVYEVEKKFMQS